MSVETTTVDWQERKQDLEEKEIELDLFPMMDITKLIGSLKLVQSFRVVLPWNSGA